MKKTIYFLALALVQILSFAQAPAIQWQKALGGINSDIARSIQPTTDGGYIVAGDTQSNNGDVTGNHGGYDAWVVKLSSTGSLQWQKALGGTGDEYAHSIQPTTDGGYIVAGATLSNDGDVTGNHDGWDAWVVKLSSTGSVQWQKALGGTGNDTALSIQPTTDGGYILAGETQSNDGDVTGNHGSNGYVDAWVVKLSSSGSLQWQKCLGGTVSDFAQSIQPTADGGYIIAGGTQSTDGDVTGNHGAWDEWVIKLSNTGSLQWQKALGGTAIDKATSIQPTTDGGYIVAGYTQSNDGDVTGNHGGSVGGYDAWVVKLSSTGSLQWQKALGGTSNDYAYSIQPTPDGGYIMAGDTNSIDGDVIGNHGFSDAWVVKLSSTGSLQWQKSLGGTNGDDALSIQIIPDGGYILACQTVSFNGDVSGNHGGQDAWVVKLAADVAAPTASEQTLNTGSTVANLVATGSNLQWYSAATGGTALATSTVLATGTYYVSQTVGGLESPRTSVSVTIISPYTAIPDANFEQALFDLGIDTVNGDHQVLTSAISGVTLLYVSNKGISNLSGIEGFTSLQRLDCSDNQLTSLNLSGLTSLTFLMCYSNQLTSLNLGGLTALTYLYCYNNQLPSLNVSGLTALTYLNCYNNQLPSLNVSGLTALINLNCSINQLTSLNLSGLIALTDLNCSNNQLPSLNVSGLNNLQTLHCSGNQLPSLNVSGLTNLQTLNCSNNLLLSLNVSGLTALNFLHCSNNHLPSLDVSGLTALTELNCSWNQLPSLNVSGLTALTLLACSNNQLPSLNVSGLTNLQNLDCSWNQLPSLNVSGLTALTLLACSNNQLPSLNVSGLTTLIYLNCSNNQLPSIEVSGLTVLNYLNCSNNQLTSLNVSTNTAIINLDCTNNAPSLTCITVSDPVVTFANPNWLKDATSSYSTNCGLILYTTIPDANFEQSLFDQGIDTINGDHQVLISAISGVTSLDVSNKTIADLTGIEGFTSLQTLHCSNNQLTSLNVSGLTNLQFLDCDSNQLPSLNVSGLTSLYWLTCSFNQLPNLNVSGLSNLQILDCTWNPLPSLNVSGLTALTHLYCSYNLLTSLNLSSNTALTELYCTNNASLTCITVADVAAANANSSWIKDASANYSTNCSLVIPTSKVKANQCGVTLAALNSNINADYVPNYQAYRFEVTNGATVNTVDVNKYNFSLTQTPGITYDTTFGVRVAVKMGGNWGAYGASCNVTTPALTSNVIPTTTIMPIFCGSTLAALNTKIGAKPVYNATGYRFEIIKEGVTTIYDSAVYNFRLADAGIAAYGTTYNIRVAAQINGVYGNYGASCNVTTPVLTANIIPTTTIMPSFCGITLIALDTKIGATPVYATTGYRFEITKEGVTTIYDSAVYNFRLADAGVAAYGTTYSIRVAALVNGVYGNYGASCNVSTPAAISNNIPTTNIIPSLCGTTLASKDAKITAIMIIGATNGRYEIIKAGSAPVVYEVASTVIKLSQTGVVVDYNTAYTIRVAAFIGGIWGNYGTSCTVTTPAAPIARLKAKTFEVSAYPNPFETAFNLNVETPSKEKVTIAVYDMMGKLVETHQVNPIDVANLQIGNNFAAGIYNVIVSQANEMQAIRLIRK